MRGKYKVSLMNAWKYENDGRCMKHYTLQSLKEKYKYYSIANYLSIRMDYDKSIIKKADTVIEFLGKLFYSKGTELDVLEFLSSNNYTLNFLSMNLDELVYKLHLLKKINLDLEVLLNKPIILSRYGINEIYDVVKNIEILNIQKDINASVFEELLKNRYVRFKEKMDLDENECLIDIKKYITRINLESAYRQSNENKENKNKGLTK